MWSYGHSQHCSYLKVSLAHSLQQRALTAVRRRKTANYLIKHRLVSVLSAANYVFLADAQRVGIIFWARFGL